MKIDTRCTHCGRELERRFIRTGDEWAAFCDLECARKALGCIDREKVLIVTREEAVMFDERG